MEVLAGPHPDSLRVGFGPELGGVLIIRACDEVCCAIRIVRTILRSRTIDWLKVDTRQRATQSRSKLNAGLKTLSGIFAERPRQSILQRDRQSLVDFTNAVGDTRCDSLGDEGRLKWMAPGQELKKYNRRRKQFRPGVALLPRDLFGSHVIGCPENLTSAGQNRSRQPHQAEIQYLCLRSKVHKQVAGFDVPVHDA